MVPLRLKYLRRGNCDRSRKTGDSNHKALHFGSRKDAQLSWPPRLRDFCVHERRRRLKSMRLGGDSVKGGRI